MSPLGLASPPKGWAAVRASFEPDVVPLLFEYVYCILSVNPLLKRRDSDTCSASYRSWPPLVLVSISAYGLHIALAADALQAEIAAAFSMSNCRMVVTPITLPFASSRFTMPALLGSGSPLLIEAVPARKVLDSPRRKRLRPRLPTYAVVRIILPGS